MAYESLTDEGSRALSCTLRNEINGTYSISITSISKAGVRK